MNKYQIYVSQEDLFNYIQENNVPNKRIFREQDFLYVYPDPGYSFLDSREFINGYVSFNLPEELKGLKKVTPEEFLIAIGYLPEKPKVSSSKVFPIKAEDIHYICESYQQDFLSVRKSVDNALVSIKEGGRESTIKLSPEGLIELGSDLVRLGVSLRDGTYEE